MHQVTIPLPGLPISLHCLSDASVALTPSQKTKGLVDLPSDSGGHKAIFDAEGFSIGDEDFYYGERYYYKEIPVLLSWLQQLQLELPKFK